MLFNLPKAHLKTALLLGFGQLLSWGTCFYTLGVLAQPMSESMGVSRTTVYALFSAGLLASGLVSPMAGRFIQRRGGRRALMLSNLLFATAHLILASAPNVWVLGVGWVLMCLAMPLGVYEAAFATVVGLYGPQSRPLFGVITVVAGLGSSVSWPLTSAIAHALDWRMACVFWALMQVLVSWSVHRSIVSDRPVEAPKPVAVHHLTPQERHNLRRLTASFVCIAFTFSTMAAHLPRLLEMLGLTATSAIAVASLFGLAQFSARLSDFTVLRSLPPLGLARFAHSVLVLAPAVLMLGGADWSAGFTVMHGIGIGLLTLSKGILPLELFGQGAYAAMASRAEAFARVTAALSPYLFGLAMEHWGVYAMGLYLTAALVGVFAVMQIRPVVTHSVSH